MKTTLIFLSLSLLCCTTVFAQEATPKPIESQGLTLDKVVGLVEAKTPNDLIISVIQKTPGRMEITSKDFDNLRKKKVPDEIIDAILKEGYKRPVAQIETALKPSESSTNTAPESNPVSNQTKAKNVELGNGAGNGNGSKSTGTVAKAATAAPPTTSENKQPKTSEETPSTSASANQQASNDSQSKTENPSGLQFRAIVGFEQAGAVAAKTKSNVFINLQGSMPFPWCSQRCRDMQGWSPWRIWGDVRLTSVPQQTIDSLSSLSTSFPAANVANVQANKLTQGIEFLAGAEYQLFPWGSKGSFLGLPKKDNFRITEKSIESLKQDGVAQELLNRLTKIKGLEYKGKKEFTKALASTFSQEELNQIEPSILKIAKFYDPIDISRTQTRYSLSFVFSGGAISPLVPDAGATSTFYKVDNSAYTTDRGNEYATLYPLTKDERAACLKATAKPDTSTSCILGGDIKYVGFLSPDRERFYRQYYAGFRFKTIYPDKQLVDNGKIETLHPFPAILDVTFGQNEAVTKGTLKGTHLRLDAFYPLTWSGVDYIYLFGTAYLRFKHSEEFRPIILEETTARKATNGGMDTIIRPFDSDVFLRVLPTINRDYYRIGIGLDISKFVQQITNKKPAGNSSQNTPSEATSGGNAGQKAATPTATGQKP